MLYKHLLYSPQQSHEIGILIVLILQISKLRHKEVKKFALVHTARNQGTERLRLSLKVTQ